MVRDYWMPDIRLSRIFSADILRSRGLDIETSFVLRFYLSVLPYIYINRHWNTWNRMSIFSFWYNTLTLHFVFLLSKRVVAGINICFHALTYFQKLYANNVNWICFICFRLKKKCAHANLVIRSKSWRHSPSINALYLHPAAQLF